MKPKPDWRRTMEHAAIAQQAARMLVAGAASLVTMTVLNPRVVPGALGWAVRETFRAWREGLRRERAAQRRRAS